MNPTSAYILSQVPAPECPAHSFKVQPLNGAYGITAILPTLKSIVDHQEGDSQFSYGYYRLATRPLLYRIQEGFAQYYGVNHCIAYTSLRTALMEALDYFLLPRASTNLYVIHASNSSSGKLQHALNSLSGLNTNLISLDSENWSSESAKLPQRKDVVLIAPEDANTWLKENTAFLERLKNDRIPALVCSPELPETAWNFSLSPYWIAALNNENSQIEGGVLLNHSDRQNLELLERQKRRGGILCTRNIAAFLNPENTEGELSPQADDAQKEAELLEQFRKLEDADSAFLFPSGMSAIGSLMTLLQQGQRTRIVVIGLLFTDTQSLSLELKVRGKANDSVLIGWDELDQLPELLNENTAAIITESISNPLIDVPDLEFIAKTAKANGVPFILDNTLATPVNCKGFEWGADYVVHSTTKYFSGNNKHGGGLLLTRTPEQTAQIKTQQEQWGSKLSPLEMRFLWSGMQDFEERMQRFNRNGLRVAQFLETHPKVEQVFYCGLPAHRSHQNAKKFLKAQASLIGFTLKEDNLEGLSCFYDADLTPIHKAPGLGSDESLICPYTVLAHYHASDEHLKELGLSRSLVRIAVGSEKDISPILDALNRGLEA